MWFRVSPPVLVLLLVVLADKCHCEEDLPENSMPYSMEVLQQNAQVEFGNSSNPGDEYVEDAMISKGSIIDEKIPIDILTDLLLRIFETLIGIMNAKGISDFLSDEKAQQYFMIARETLNKYEKVLQNISDGCIQDLLYVAETITRTDGWAWRMIDAVGRPQTSLLRGNVMLVGAYDECLDVVTVDGPIINGQYCLLSVKPLINQKMEVIAAKVFNSVLGTTGISLLEKITLDYGICIPSSCSKEDVNTAAKGLVLTNKMDSMVQVSGQCTNKQDSRQFTSWDWFTIWILLILLVFVVISTAYDLLKTGSKNLLLTSFSICTNWKGLMSQPSQNSAGMLNCIFGIRFLSIVWIVSTHRFILQAFVPFQNPSVINSVLIGVKSLYLNAGPVAVDTFFVLSGLLLSYTSMNALRHSNQWFNVPVFYLLRYLRLSPAYYFMLLFHSTLQLHLGDGQFWFNFLRNNLKSCQSLWYNLLYVNNYFYSGSLCMGQSWYLAADMQLFLISPILLYVAWKRPMIARYLMTALVVIGVTISFISTSYYKIGAGTINPSILKGADRTKVDHYPTHMRYTPWVIGFFTGCLLHGIQGRKWRLSKMCQVSGWVMFIASSMFATFGRLHFQRLDIVYDPIIDPLYNALSRPLWAIAVCWLIFACVVGYAGPLNTFLSWRYFHPLSRLTYGIFLVHISVQSVQRSSSRTPIFFHQGEEMLKTFGDILMSVLVAIPLVLVLESPIVNLTKVFMQKGSGNSEKDKNGASFNKIKY